MDISVVEGYAAACIILNLHISQLPLTLIDRGQAIAVQNQDPIQGIIKIINHETPYFENVVVKATGCHKFGNS